MSTTSSTPGGSQPTVPAGLVATSDEPMRPLQLVPPIADQAGTDDLTLDGAVWRRLAYVINAAYDQADAAAAAMVQGIVANKRVLVDFYRAVHNLREFEDTLVGVFTMMEELAWVLKHVQAGEETESALSRAAQIAQHASTKEEFGDALTLLRHSSGLSLNALAKRLENVKPYTAKSTLSRACSGKTLFRHRDSLTAFVTACGAGHELEVWVQAWESLREQSRRSPTLAARARDVAVKACSTGAVPAEAGVVGLAGDRRGQELARRGAAWLTDSEVLGEIRVPYTRGHIRAAVVLLAATGLTATTTSTPTVRNAGDIVLGIAAGLALYEMLFHSPTHRTA